MFLSRLTTRILYRNDLRFFTVEESENKLTLEKVANAMRDFKSLYFRSFHRRMSRGQKSRSQSLVKLTTEMRSNIYESIGIRCELMRPQNVSTSSTKRKQSQKDKQLNHYSLTHRPTILFQCGAR